MSWASNRQTSRPEDIAYSLLGLFDVNMPLLYGEGEYKAFQRLQYEIVRLRRDESIFAWSRPFKVTEKLRDQLPSISPNPLDYAIAPAPGLLAPSPNHFSESGDIVRIDEIHFGRVDLRAPPILFDGLVWTLERSFITDKDRKKRMMLAEGEIPYMAPLACAKASDMLPVKLQMVMSPYSPPRRGPSASLESFTESEMRKLQSSEDEEYRLTQEQPRAHDPFVTWIFCHGFTLRLSKSAQHQCSRPSESGPGVELRTIPEPDTYIVSTSEDSQHRAGIVIQHKKGAVIEVLYNSSIWHMVMSVNTQIFEIDFGGRSNRRGHNLISLGDSAIVPLEQGQNISVSPKLQQRIGQSEIVVYIDCDTENLEGLPEIFSDD